MTLTINKQTLCSDPWSIVSLAYFLRYPNPYASHIISCDVISRTVTHSGTLQTTRLILKRGSLPRWAPKGIISRAESWVLEESEVDPLGQTLRCTTKNLEFTKVMKMEESVFIRQTEDGYALQSAQFAFYELILSQENRANYRSSSPVWIRLGAHKAD